MKKKVIFVTMSLTRGGTERTLIEALDVIDYNKYDVTLYLRKDMITFLPLVNKNVKVIINDEAPDFEKSIFGRLCFCLSELFRIFGMNALSRKLMRSQRKYVLRKRREYEYNRYFKNSEEFDLAISYDMAKECALFTDLYVKAPKKYAYLHACVLDAGKIELFSRFDKIVCVNSLIAGNIKKSNPQIREKITSVENFITPQTIKDTVADCANESAEKPFEICTCARIVPVKGFDIAVDAAKILADNGVDFVWYFVGSGDETEKLKKQIAGYNLSDKVIITGFQSNPYVYVNRCDLYVQPSREEPHATTILEALVLCKAIVSTKTTAGEYILNRYHGGVVTGFTAESIAEAIIDLYNNPQKIKEIVEKEKNIDWVERKKEYTDDINNLLY